jgi:hypothetical protein
MLSIDDFLPWFPGLLFPTSLEGRRILGGRARLMGVWGQDKELGRAIELLVLHGPSLDHHAVTQPAQHPRRRPPNERTHGIADVPNKDPMLGDRSRYSTSIYRCLWQFGLINGATESMSISGVLSRIHVEEEIDESRCRLATRSRAVMGLARSISWAFLQVCLPRRQTEGPL